MFFGFFAACFTIMYGRDLANFTTITKSFLQLWRMPFAEEWDALDLEDATPFSQFVAVFFLLVFMILLNLFIAIVTDVYV